MVELLYSYISVSPLHMHMQHVLACMLFSSSHIYELYDLFLFPLSCIDVISCVCSVHVIFGEVGYLWNSGS